MGGNNSKKLDQQTLSTKSIFSSSQSQSQGVYQKLKQQYQICNCKCSWKTRIIGFIVCCVFGWIISLISSILFIIRHDSTQFAIWYSVGQILNITGSCFLSGPVQQAKDMVKSSRIIYSLLYVFSTIVTLLLGLFLPDNLSPLVFLSMVIQIVSYFLYTISFLPFGTKILKKLFTMMIS